MPVISTDPDISLVLKIKLWLGALRDILNSLPKKYKAAFFVFLLLSITLPASVFNALQQTENRSRAATTTNIAANNTWSAVMKGRGINVLNHHPIFIDINNDGKKEILSGSSDGYVHIFQNNGTYLPGWPQYIGGHHSNATGGYTSNPAVIDLNGDGKKEIIISNVFNECENISTGYTCYMRNGVWVFSASGLLYSSSWPKFLIDKYDVSSYRNPLMVVDDLDFDGKPEIITSDGLDKIHILNNQGIERSGYPFQIGTHPALVQAAVGNVAGDAKKEIVLVETYWFPNENKYPSKVHVLDLNGKELTGWPKTMDVIEGTNLTIWSPPTLVDLDNNGLLDITATVGVSHYNVYQAHGRIMAWKGTGEYVSGWPITELCGNTNPLEAQGNPALAPPAVGKLLPGGKLGVAIETSLWKVCIYSADGKFQKRLDLPNSNSSTYPNFTSGMALADFNNDGVQELLIGSNFRSLYALDINGNQITSISIPYSILSNPFIADLDNNGQLEIGAMASPDDVPNPYYFNPSLGGWGINTLYVWPISIASTYKIDLPMWTYDERHTNTYGLFIAPSPTKSPTPIPSKIPTKTPTPIKSPTPIPSKTPTPKPTSTPTPGITNVGFDIDTNNDGTPDYWERKHLAAGDKRVTSESYGGGSSFQMTTLTTGNPTKSLSQPIAKYKVPKGTTFTLTAWNKLPYTISSGFIKATVLATKKNTFGTITKTNYELVFPKTSHNWTKLQRSFKLADDADSLTVKVKYSGIGSRTFFDAIRWTSPATSLTYSPPSAPDSDD
ncbi:VCBS repeat-containing protein [Candidatus Gottesmanbacteria bacterium]|nr:VCBS repeat-containing protein [Candidatus Gottesmanbacteria bacterium]